LAVDVRDSQGRLVVRAGERVTSSLMDRLRKMGILEIFVTTSEASSADFWLRWGEDWLRTARSRLLLVTPETGVPKEMLDRFDGALENAVKETVRQRIRSMEP
jgi:FAD/FMN-containing dehydrogenase